MYSKSNFTNNSRRGFNCVLAALALALTVPARAETQPPAIPFSDIGARATANYQGDALGITATADAVRLRCGFQTLDGHATPEGLWLESTKPGGGQLRLVAVAVGRSGSRARQCALTEAASSVRSGMSIVTVPQCDQAPLGAPRTDGAASCFDMPLLTELETTFPEVPFSALGRAGLSTLNSQPSTILAATGTVSVVDKLVRFTRPGLTEEYSVSVDGVRQDFVIESPPLNPPPSAVLSTLRSATKDGLRRTGLPSTLNSSEGDLRVELVLSGARAEATAYGIKLAFEGSGRVLAYSRLHAQDAAGRELSARLEVLSADRLVVSVADADATYPVRIDPTFSDANWYSLGQGMDGFDAGVYALAIIGTNLYAGGHFTTAGGVAANNIAKWDGSAWSSLGSGIGGSYPVVYALAVSGTNLYVGGQFVMTTWPPANNIAKWDGSAWSALGSGVGGQVNALAVSGTILYAGGFFNTPGLSMASWDGSTWSALGSGVTTYGGGGMGYVYALAVSGTNLYVGGYFDTAGGVHATNIAKWDGIAWSAVGSGLNNNVQALLLNGTSLYAGGAFTTAGAVQVSSIAKWDGLAWSGLGSGIGVGSAVSALLMNGTNLYAGGQRVIATWDGRTWWHLGSEVNGDLRALAVDGAGHLFVGGAFTVAGTNACRNIAQASLFATPPAVATFPATALTINSATLIGTVNPNGLPTGAWFKWGTTTNYGNLSPVTDMGSGTNTLPLSFPLAGLTPGVTYHFRLVATNNDAGYGVDQSFTTMPLTPPTVATLPPTAVTTNSATLNGTVKPNCFPTAAWFEWGTTPSYGNLTAAMSMGSGTAELPLSALLDGLTIGTRYHFRLVATNSIGVAYGSDQTFATPGGTGVVSTCAEAALRAAIDGGGAVTFACDGTITLSNTITNDVDLILDGRGHQVTINSSGGVRGFFVKTNVTFTAINLTIANGYNPVGGGIYNDGGTVNLLSVSCRNNVGWDGGAAIFNHSGTVSATNCSFTGNTLRMGQTNARGGAIFNDSGLLNLQQCLFLSNSAIAWPWTASGGAIHNEGTLSASDCTFVQNTAGGGTGSGSQAGLAGGAALGGAICDAGGMLIERSLFVSNTVIGGTGGAGQDIGLGFGTPPPAGTGGAGGAAWGAAVFVSGPASLVNCTLTGNFACGGLGGKGGRGGAQSLGVMGPFVYYPGGNGGCGGTAGGAAAYDSAGALRLTNCTIAFNSSVGGDGGAGGLSYTNGPPQGYQGAMGVPAGALQTTSGVSLNCILASNSPTNCTGSIADAGHNLSSDASGAFTNTGSVINIDAKLGALADNGGPTLTMALLPGSPAIDAGATSLAPATDQRGFPRPFGPAADIGAYESAFVLPEVWTWPATAVTSTNAILNAEVYPNGYPTTAWFEWGTTTNYGNLIDRTGLGSGTNVLPFSVPLAGLTHDVAYHYRVAASNSLGVIYGSDQSFVARDAGIVRSPTEAALRGALAGGGTVTFACDGTIALSGTVIIAADSVLDGAGHQVTISGGNTVRVFCVTNNAAFSMANLTVSNGRAPSGGAILNAGGRLRATNCVFAANYASGLSGYGGAIQNESGEVYLSACVFTDNHSSGASYANGLSGGSGRGGALDNSGTLTADLCGFTSNSAAGADGQPDWNPSHYGTPGGSGGDGQGGAIGNFGTMTIMRSLFTHNSAVGGPGAYGLAGFYGDDPGMSGTSGGAGGSGGAGQGGAIYNAGTLRVISTTLAYNSGNGGGGGAGGNGGGSAINGGGPGGNGGNGGSGYGAIYGSTCELTNCTVAWNSGEGASGGYGGAGGMSPHGSANPGASGASGSGCGGIGASGAKMVNTVLAGGGNCCGSITDYGHNLSSDNTCAFTNIGSMNNTDPMLGPLTNNGGPTLTMALLPGSLAINAADTTAAPPTDQRGVPRPFGVAADIGAFEFWPTLQISRSGANGLDILASGISGQTCRLLASSNFLNWMPLATSQFGTNGTVLFYDNYAPGNACRFYRLVMP